MAWFIIPRHGVAHLTATSVSAVVTGYERDSFRTLDPNAPVFFNTSPVVVVFDRGTATGLSTINSFAVINHNLVTTGTILVEESTVSDVGPWSTISAASSVTANGKDYYRNITDTTARWLQVTITNTPNPKIGVFTLGRSHSLGEATLPYTVTGSSSASGNATGTLGFSRYAGHQYGFRTITANFRNVTTSVATTVVNSWSRNMLWNVATDNQDGVGGGGGSNPIVLVDTSGNVYYGYASITHSQWTQTIAELRVSLDEMTYHPRGN